MLNEPPTFCQELELPAAAGSDLVNRDYCDGAGKFDTNSLPGKNRGPIA